MAITDNVRIDDAAPTHATVPVVKNLHKTVPVTPSGRLVKENWMMNTFGEINVTYRISATAKFTRR